MKYIYVIIYLTYIYVILYYNLMNIKNTNLCFKCKKTCIDNNYYGLHKRCYIEWFGCTKDDRLIAVTPEEVKKKRIDARGFEEITSSFFQGKYKKYSATLGNS